MGVPVPSALLCAQATTPARRVAGYTDVPPKLQSNFEDTAGFASSVVRKTATDGRFTQKRA